MEITIAPQADYIGQVGSYRELWGPLFVLVLPTLSFRVWHAARRTQQLLKARTWAVGELRTRGASHLRGPWELIKYDEGGWV